MASRSVTKTGGRPATTGVIRGRYALSVGNPGSLIPDGWRWIALSEIARLESGHTPSRKHPEYWVGDIPWIGIADATENHGRVIQDTHQHTNKLGIANSSARILPANTVCLSRTASVGYVVVMGRPMATSQDFVNWVCSDALDYRYLKYVLLAERQAFLRFASGTTHQTIYFPEVKAFHIALPPIAEQSAIAGILCAIDERIELNRRMNETLEAIAREVFAFREEQEAWEELPLGTVCTIYDGPHATPHLTSTGPIFLGISNLANGLLDLTGVNHVSDDDFAKWTRRVTPKVGDVVFSYETRLGQAAIIPNGLKCCLGRRMGLLRPKMGKADGNVLLRAYLGARFQETIRQHTVPGSTVDRIPLREMSEFLIKLPQGEDLKRLAAQLSPMRSMVEHNEQNSHTLTALRDALLPKLISGELRVKDAEKRVEALV